MIHVVDSIMGSGKTTFVTEKLHTLTHDHTRFIYVTPFLDEVTRVIKECHWANFHQPNETEHGSKSKNLIHLIRNGHNIATTHSLFSLLNQEACRELRQHEYILILDEVMECVSFSNSITNSDLKVLIDGGHLRKDDVTSKLSWRSDEGSHYHGKFNDVVRLCSNNKLVLHGDDIVLEQFPSEFLDVFTDVYVLTYLFEGSPMSAYLTKHGHAYEMLTLVDHELRPWADHCDESSIKSELRSLITVYEGPMNKVGTKVGKSHPLSVSWYQTQIRGRTSALPTLKGSTQNYFRKIAGTASKHNAWTTFCDYQGKLKGERYTKGFIPFNCRATNQYVDKRSLAYLCNVFPNPVIRQYLGGQGIGFNPDLYAISEMVQWIWRSQIRRRDPIHLFIPSERMRDLLCRWLECRSMPELIKQLA